MTGSQSIPEGVRTPGTLTGNFLSQGSYIIPTRSPYDLVGGVSKKWTHTTPQLGEHFANNQPLHGEEMVNRPYVIQPYLNVDERPRIDDRKLIISLHVDRSKYTTHEEIYHEITKWWVNIKNRSATTVKDRICHARSMQHHPIYPVDWLQFDPVQILNQLLYRQIHEYPELAKKTGRPTYGVTQLNNLWKVVRMFSEAYGVDISHWGWTPPTPPEPQVKIVPRPETVNKLMHHWYTNDRFENALIRTLLTVGFHTGVRPEELVILKVKDVRFDEGYLLIHEQKKKYRERQVWIDESVLSSRQQNSLRNWVILWRPRKANEKSGDFLFIQKNGTPFPSAEALRMYLMPFCKPVWPDFKPRIMRDWSAIARLIRTKIETKKWDTRIVKNDLGHKHEKTTESYIRFAENYYRRDPYDWLRAVLKFHPDSKRMLSLRQEYGPSQEVTVIVPHAM